MTESTAQIRRYIGRGEAVLVLGEHEGTTWASNRYWLCPAAHIQPFLDKHGIDSTGAYEVNGSTVKPFQGPPWNPSELLDLAKYTVPLGNAWIGEDGPGWGIGRSQVYIRDGDGNMAEVVTTPDGDHLAIRADWLDWLEGAPAPGGREDGMPGEITLAATEKARTSERHPGPVALILRDIAPEDGEDDHARIIAVIMPLADRVPDASATEDQDAAA
jgi:hypothetical protein